MTTTDRPSTSYQPTSSAGLGSSVIGWVRNLFAPATPVYRGDGQPVAQGGGLFGGTPSYRVPPPLPPVIPPSVVTPPVVTPPAVPVVPPPAPIVVPVVAQPDESEAPEALFPDEPGPMQGCTACHEGAVTIVIAARD